MKYNSEYDAAYGYYDRLGVPITLEKWAELHKDKEYIVVCQERGTDDTVVSTIWLGIPHGYIENAKDNRWPLIFETLVFSGEHGGEIDGTRYATEEEALLGHTFFSRQYLGTTLISTPTKESEIVRATTPDSVVMGSFDPF